ncbi:MAG: HEAT repeat domain-containing protein, partial [Planctomycetota bacterium]
FSLTVSAALTSRPSDWKSPGSVPVGSDGERSLAIFRLGHSRHPRALETLLELSKSGDNRDRRDAAYGLGYHGSSAALDALKRAATDEAPDVRRAAVYSLGSFEGAASLSVLLRSLAQDEKLDVAREANRSLEKITGLDFEAGFASRILRERDRQLALAFWRSAFDGRPAG